MKKALGMMAVVGWAAVLCGCANRLPANTVEITVVSQPAGAYISEKYSSNAGLSPLVLHYPIAKMEVDKNGCYIASGFDARWGSGAAATSGGTLRMCPPANKFKYVLKRNLSDPGLDKDLAFENQLGQQQQAAQAAQSAKEDAMIEALATGFAGAMDARAAAQQQRQQQAPIRCTSKKVFERVETVCN